MNCLCNWFEDSTVWLIIIALLILYFGCNGSGNYNGCIPTGNNGGGCGCDYGCGCQGHGGICN